MSEFPSVEAHELVTKEFLRAELATVETRFAAMETRLTLRVGAALTACAAVLAAVNLIG